MTLSRSFRKGKRILGKLGDTVFGSLADFLFPPVCRMCEKPMPGTFYLCTDCVRRLARNGSFTWKKGRPGLPDLAGPIYLEGVLTFWLYSEEVEALIHRVKYRGMKNLGRVLGRMAGYRLKSFAEWPENAVLIPVPLHPARERERGFNQSLWIAKGIAEKLGNSLNPELLIRKKNTRSQTRLSAFQRQTNVRDAFRVDKPEHVDGGEFILVDDVLTTGATMNSCARVLKKAGAARIQGITLARPSVKQTGPRHFS
jgi:ComF family protein